VADVWVIRGGLRPYEEARQAQKALEEARHAGEVPDVLILLEHSPVYTKGRRTEAGELPMGEDWYRMQGIEVCQTDRGGRATYHGPGQLVAYPIVDLAAYGGDVHEFVRRMEQVMVAALGDWGVAAGCIEGLTGVWTEGCRPDEWDGTRKVACKIGSIGVHVNRAITTHGLAINVNNDLQPFEWIVPCGIEHCQMTSLSRELQAEQDLEAFATAVRDHYGDIYDRAPVEVPGADLADRVPGAAALAGESAAAVR
jgi:lipoyl(octanoyl) transferase